MCAAPRGNSPSCREATKTLSKRAARTRRGSAILTRSSTGPLQTRTRIAGQRPGERFGQRRQALELGPLGHRGGDRPGGARLQLGAHAGAHRRRQRADLGGQARRPAGGLAEPGDVLRRLAVLLLPELQCRRGCLDAIAAQPALEPVDPSRRGARGAAQVAQQVGRPAGAQHRFQQGDQRASDRGGGGRDLRLERGRDPVGLEDRGDQRAAPGRVADDDRDLLRLGPVGEQARHLDRDRLGLATLAGRAQEDEALVDGAGAAARRRRSPARGGRGAASPVLPGSAAVGSIESIPISSSASSSGALRASSTVCPAS